MTAPFKAASLLFALSTAAGAGGAPSRPVLAARLAARGADAALTAEALGVVESAARAGLPVGPVEDKILEGLAKGAPPARAVEVARSLSGRLRAAADVVDSAAGGRVEGEERNAAILDLAIALGRGASHQALTSVARAAAPAWGLPAVAAAARAMGRLCERGADGAEAEELVRALLARPDALKLLEQLAPLLDEYRAAGGEAPGPLLREALARARTGLSLDGMIDPQAGRPGVPLRPSAEGAPAVTPASGPLQRSPGPGEALPRTAPASAKPLVPGPASDTRVAKTAPGV